MALGAGVALLFAPKPGRELRRQIFARFERGRPGHAERGGALRDASATAGV